MRIVFMGTPDFAVPCLEALIKNGHNVTMCVTKPDMPVGRKQILTAPPVKIKALENNIELTGTAVDYILEGVNNYLMALAKEQIRLAFHFLHQFIILTTAENT